MRLGPAKLMSSSSSGIIHVTSFIARAGWRVRFGLKTDTCAAFLITNYKKREEDKNGSSKALQCPGQGQQQWIRIGFTGSGISAGPTG